MTRIESVRIESNRIESDPKHPKLQPAPSAGSFHGTGDTEHCAPRKVAQRKASDRKADERTRSERCCRWIHSLRTAVLHQIFWEEHPIPSHPIRWINFIPQRNSTPTEGNANLHFTSLRV
mmetsp:Transcript_26063/g.61233  ORF Transcript_26063/g.61233 Transcript_26063/m.61233 type:complete len:120 (-) Transcript_26063:341-700(-)